MKRSWLQLALLAGLVLIAAYVADKQRLPELQTLQTVPAASPPGSGNRNGFDFYVLALSWSPSYCEMKGADADREQCGGKPLGFTVHGLWPQYERGFPESCSFGEPVGVSRDILRQIDTVMPSDGLARHEWKKHGTCSGLGQDKYFEVLVEAFSKIRVPDQYYRVNALRSVSPKRMEADFVASNQGLGADGIAAICDDGFFTEVRICLSKELAFRACPQVKKNACRAASVNLPPVK
jgi:ribonuclease T2